MRKFLLCFYIIYLVSAFFYLENLQAFEKDSKPHRYNDKKNKRTNTREVRETDISFSIEPFYDVHTLRLIVVLEFQGDRSGVTKIILPGTSSPHKGVTEIKYLKPLSTNTTIEDTNEPLYKTVKYSPGSYVKIYYQVEDARSGDAKVSNYYSPLITKQYFHFFSDAFFIFPNWDANNVYNFRVTWNHFPSNVKLVNSFGINHKSQVINTALWKFRHAVFAGGDFHIIQQKVNSTQIYFAARGKWKFPIEQLCNISKGIMNAENNFWNDNSDAYRVAIILPFDESNSQIAEIRTNAFSLFLSPNKSLDYNVKETIAAEYFRNWINNGMPFSEPQQLVYWFKEGICKYYGRLILLRCGQISLDEYLSTYNNDLDEYFTSSYRYEKNEKTVKELWTNHDLSRVTVLRGEIIAHNLNAAIMKNTNGAKSLDDFVRDLYRRCRTESLVISNGSLGALIRFYAGDDALSEIMRTLNSGTLIKVNPNALGPCFYPATKTERRFWFFGEEYEIPVYKLKNNNVPADKNCLWWFGAD